MARHPTITRHIGIEDGSKPSRQTIITDGYNLQTSNHPGKGQGSGGNCKGDSGGPVLLDDSNIVVGILSFGQNGLCRGVDFSYRTDTETAQDFLDPYLP